MSSLLKQYLRDKWCPWKINLRCILWKEANFEDFFSYYFRIVVWKRGQHHTIRSDKLFLLNNLFGSRLSKNFPHFLIGNFPLDHPSPPNPNLKNPAYTSVLTTDILLLLNGFRWVFYIYNKTMWRLYNNLWLMPLFATTSYTHLKYTPSISIAHTVFLMSFLMNCLHFCLHEEAKTHTNICRQCDMCFMFGWCDTTSHECSTC